MQIGDSDPKRDLRGIQLQLRTAPVRRVAYSKSATSLVRYGTLDVSPSYQLAHGLDTFPVKEYRSPKGQRSSLVFQGFSPLFSSFQLFAKLRGVLNDIVRH